ncbi:MAG: septum formation protein Maf [Bacteroidaceae bacterium]|nr:septum formation protein Maf [Bacteroidaceae bacterium]
MLQRERLFILGSNSPRRRELLAGLGIDFEVRVAKDVDESYPASLVAEQIPLYISQQKAKAYVLSPDDVLITADTIVWLDGCVLGKPVDEADAVRMLHQLSGQTHQVFTGVTIRFDGETHSFSAASDVTFDSLTDEEINYYVKNFRPLDKAGAYGIQEWIGYVGVTGLHGSYFNVMGLPVQKLYSELKKLHLI